MDDFVGWILTGVAAIVSTLAAVVATLWKANESKNSQAIEELERRVNKSEQDIRLCEEDRVELRVQLAGLQHLAHRPPEHDKGQS